MDSRIRGESYFEEENWTSLELHIQLQEGVHIGDPKKMHHHQKTTRSCFKTGPRKYVLQQKGKTQFHLSWPS